MNAVLRENHVILTEIISAACGLQASPSGSAITQRGDQIVLFGNRYYALYLTALILTAGIAVYAMVRDKPRPALTGNVRTPLDLWAVLLWAAVFFVWLYHDTCVVVDMEKQTEALVRQVPQGEYVVKPEDLPVTRIYHCDASDLRRILLRDLAAGEKSCPGCFNFTTEALNGRRCAIVNCV